MTSSGGVRPLERKRKEKKGRGVSIVYRGGGVGYARGAKRATRRVRGESRKAGQRDMSQCVLTSPVGRRRDSLVDRPAKGRLRTKEGGEADARAPPDASTTRHAATNSAICRETSATEPPLHSLIRPILLIDLTRHPLYSVPFPFIHRVT